MTKIYYLEGPDGAGKSTYIKDRKEPQDIVLHNGVYPTPQHAFREYYTQIDYAMREFTTTNFKFDVWIDRGPISEMIYGLVMRDTIVDKGLFGLCMSMYRRHNVELIFCIPPYEVAHSNWAARLKESGEYIIQEKQFRQVYGMYQAIAARSMFNMTTSIFDYTQE